MMIREMVELQADFGDDVVEEDGEIGQFGGRNIALGLGELLAGLGCEVSPPVYAGDHGWAFDFRSVGRRLWCQVTQMDEKEAILVFKDVSRSFGDGFFGRPPNSIYVDVLTRLNTAMGSDPRFRAVLWYFGRGDGTDGAEGPMAEKAKPTSRR